MRRILLQAGIECTGGRIAKVPVPGGDLPAQIRVGLIGKSGGLVLAAAPEIESGNRAVAYRYHSLVYIAATPVVGGGEGYVVAALGGIGMVDVC